MRLTLAEPSYLKESISIISDLVNEARFKITPDAIELVAMDPANVAMVVFKLLSSSFTEYDVKKDIEIAINLSNLKQVLRRASPKDMLTLEMDSDNRLKVELKSNTTRTFNLPIIELEEKEQKVPDLKFPITIKTSSSVFNEAIADVDVVGESVAFIAEPKKFTLQAEGDLNQAKIDIKEDETTKVNISGEKAKAKYSIEYLKKMINGSKLSEDVVIQFNKDYPLKLEYKAVDKVMLSFILAPRVENE
ncbi:proliferating cell nuclear antigen (pcna) [Candidatus Woesearchaeota archaeon]|jgi:proliferating cell nuclear antigen|nr:proliferating cell nuclear antigen (pcna) [Candidatus Woesearchaeota archaeon]MDP6648276.1 proliferating cell nuclear antigen (pcna) [Candidatus Woesearchaeota archaeon]|tara:strand:- start:31225 stop:31968 length:744 start_codon:yes stop_codon:yes gene_type:complete